MNRLMIVQGSGVMLHGLDHLFACCQYELKVGEPWSFMSTVNMLAVFQKLSITYFHPGRLQFARLQA